MKSDFFIQDTTLTSIADALRSKVNISSFLTIKEITNIISEMSAETYALRKYVNGELSSIFNSTVTNVGSNRFYSNEYITNINFPACTAVKDSAFCYCSNLIDVNLSACTTIDKSAFYNCRNLTNINIPNCTFVNEYAFCNCVSLSDISLPQCTSVEKDAFQACSNLTNISLPKCTVIGSYAFYGCNRLESINLPACKTINSSAFTGCKSLKTISIPNCTSIGTYAFSDCQALTNIDFISKLTTINSGCFKGCHGLVNISHSTCTYICYNAFEDCINLTSVNFPKVTTISECVFENCSNLTDVSLPKCTTFSLRAFRDCIGLSKINLPACTSLYNLVFQGCINLTDVNLPSCKYINQEAFLQCSNLKNISLPLCRQVGAAAFSACYELSRIDLPACSLIGEFAFSNCKKLSAVILTSTTVCRLYGTSDFYNTPIANSEGYVYVPPSLVSSYQKSTNWSFFANQIVSLYDVTYVPVKDNKVLPLNYITRISVPILLKSKNFTPTFSINPIDESFMTTSNLATYEDFIEFDVTTNNIEGSTSAVISASLNDNEFSKTLDIMIEDMCDVHIKDTALILNETRRIFASLDYMTHAPEVVFTTTNDDAITISNIITTSEEIGFDITAHTIEGNVEVTMTVVYNGRTYIKIFNIGIYKAENRPLPSYTVEDLTSSYGFKINDNNYYQNTNSGAPFLFGTCAVCNVNVESLWDCIMHIDYISYGPDKGSSFISNLDTELALSGNSDSENDIRISLKDYESGGIETVSYDMTSGKHFVCIKCYKPYNASIGVTLEFTVRFEYVQ